MCLNVVFSHYMSLICDLRVCQTLLTLPLYQHCSVAVLMQSFCGHNMIEDVNRGANLFYHCMIVPRGSVGCGCTKRGNCWENQHIVFDYSPITHTLCVSEEVVEMCTRIHHDYIVKYSSTQKQLLQS